MAPLTTPGLDFLGRNLVLPATVNFAVLSVTSHQLHWTLPRWVLVLVAVTAIPVKHIVVEVYKYNKHKRIAKSLGARMPPVVDSKSFGNAALLKRLTHVWKTGYPGDVFWDIVKEFGKTFNLRIMFTDIVYTIEPHQVKRVLATDFENFEKGERFIFALEGALGSGVFNSDGEMWKFHRTMARPFFSRDRVTDLEKFDKHLQIGIEMLKERMKSGYAINFEDLVSRITLDIASDFLFGKSVNSLDILPEDLPLPYGHPLHEHSLQAFSNYPANRFSQAWFRAQSLAAERDRTGWIWPLAEMFGDKVKKDMEIVDQYIVPICEDAAKRAAERAKLGLNDGVNDDESFLDHLASGTSDIKILKDQALNILLAGRDTTASTLTFIFYFLSTHPEVLQRLRSEILAVVGSSAMPSYQQIKDMKYLRAVINETLRLLPPVPWDVRECKNGAVWPSSDPDEQPFYIPPGSAVAWGVLMIHTSEDLWGPDAAQFDPDRFLDDRKQRIIENPFIFIPFNAGPRICLGQQLAYNELSLMTIRLLQQFSSFTLDEEAFRPEHRVPDQWAQEEGPKSTTRFVPSVVLTMSSKGGMWLKATPARDDDMAKPRA